MTTCNCEPKLKLRCENVSKTFIQKQMNTEQSHRSFK